jgi:hypothetical protein
VPPEKERQITEAVTKDIVKEALKEWLDEKILIFGKWSLMTMAAAGIAALVYFILTLNGWKQQP